MNLHSKNSHLILPTKFWRISHYLKLKKGNEISRETKARNKNANSKVFDYNVHLQHGMDTEMPTHLARNLSNKEKKHITI